MSQTVFLEPRAPQDRIIYFDLRNTSDQDINIKSQIEAAFIDKEPTAQPTSFSIIQLFEDLKSWD